MSSCLIVGVALASVFWVAGVDLGDLDHVLAEEARGPGRRACSPGSRRSPLLTACSSSPLVTPVSRPPLALAAVSTEYFLATRVPALAGLQRVVGGLRLSLGCGADQVEVDGSPGVPNSDLCAA